MPLHAAQLAVLIHERRHGRTRGLRQNLKPGGGFGHGIAVRHPHVLRLWGAGEERRINCTQSCVGCAVFAGTGLRHGTAQGLRHHLKTVADAEDRHASLK